MHTKFAVTAAATALLAPAFAQSTPDGSAQGFSLVARITKQASDEPYDVEGFYVSGIHVGAGTAGMTLVNASSSGLNPAIFFANGTSQEAFYHNDSILQSYPTASQYGSGIVIADPDTAGGLHAAQINLGDGTRGVSLYGVSETDDPGSQPFLGYNATQGAGSQFIVCNTTIYGGEAPLLFWEAPETTTTPTKCAEVKLLPQCEGNVANATAYTETSYCYKDASTAPIL